MDRSWKLWLVVVLGASLALAGCTTPDENVDDGINDPDMVGDPEDDGLDTNMTNDPDAVGDAEDDGIYTGP